MGMHQSQLDRAAEATLEARLVAQRVCADGQVSPEEWRTLESALIAASDETETALAYDRIAESIRRCGRPNEHVVRTFSERVEWLRWFRRRPLLAFLPEMDEVAQ